MDERSEARRKRIVERGSDRLALITGQIASLPPAGPSPKHSYTQSSPASLFAQQHQQHHNKEEEEQHSVPSDENQSEDRKRENDALFATKQCSLARSTGFNPRNQTESHLEKANVERVAPRPPPLEPAVEAKHKPQPPQPEPPKISSKPTPLADKENHLKSFPNHLSFFTAKDINSCIISSENIRAVCSVVIALLVVLSNIGLPREAVRSRSIVGSKPLYLVLLSDVTIVAARLLEKLRNEERIRGEAKITAPHQGKRDWTDAVHVLEVSLVAYQVIRAIFIDLSCYMVVVISGISLL